VTSQPLHSKHRAFITNTKRSVIYGSVVTTPRTWFISVKRCTSRNVSTSGAESYCWAPLLIENPISTRGSGTKGALYTKIKDMCEFISVTQTAVRQLLGTIGAAANGETL